MRIQKLSHLPAKRDEKSVVLRPRKRHPNCALTETQIRVLLASIENIREDALIRLGLSVELRVSEVVSIRTSDIDFDRALSTLSIFPAEITLKNGHLLMLPGVFKCPSVHAISNILAPSSEIRENQ